MSKELSFWRKHPTLAVKFQYFVMNGACPPCRKKMFDGARDGYVDFNLLCDSCKNHPVIVKIIRKSGAK